MRPPCVPKIGTQKYCIFLAGFWAPCPGGGGICVGLAAQVSWGLAVRCNMSWRDRASDASTWQDKRGASNVSANFPVGFSAGVAP